MAEDGLPRPPSTKYRTASIIAKPKDPVLTIGDRPTTGVILNVATGKRSSWHCTFKLRSLCTSEVEVFIIIRLKICRIGYQWLLPLLGGSREPLDVLQETHSERIIIICICSKLASTINCDLALRDDSQCDNIICLILVPSLSHSPSWEYKLAVRSIHNFPSFDYRFTL